MWELHISLRELLTSLLSPIGLLLALVSHTACASSANYDVVVVSGSSGGFAAALAAGRMGESVALIEDTPVLGGILSNGLWHFDTASCQSLSGIADEFRREVKIYYTQTISLDPAIAKLPRLSKGPQEYLPIDWPWTLTRCTGPNEGGTWEPHVADLVMKRMIAKVPAVHVFYNTYATDVIMSANRVMGVVTRNKAGLIQRFLGKVVIDATPEGDVAAWAGVPYRVGREARSRLEPHAGQIHFLNETGEIMLGSTGRQDRAIPSYGLELTVKFYGESDGPAPEVSKSPGYRRADYARAGCLKEPWKNLWTAEPNGKFLLMANPIGNEMQGINWNWPADTHAQRHRLYEIYKTHALGFLYFQQHDCGLRNVGLPRDEFVDNGNVPYRLYVREARRVMGMVTMTEADINPFIAGQGLIPPMQADSIAIGYYPIDSKPDRPKTDFARPDKGSGDFYLLNAESAFQVPYGAIVPQKVNGLLVPVAMSATHVAYSAIRMEPTFMAMGQAAGTAAALSIRGEVELRDLSVEALQRELIQQKCRLFFYWDVPVEALSFKAVQWLSVKGIVTGYPDRFFRPNQTITRAEWASWVVKALHLWPSVSNVHFSDVPYDAPEFRAIETLFDNNLLQAFGVEPMWPRLGGFNAARNGDASFAQAHGGFGEFHPAQPVLLRELASMLKSAVSYGDGRMKSGRALYTTQDVEQVCSDVGAGSDAPVTRGQAASFLYRVLGKTHTHGQPSIAAFSGKSTEAKFPKPLHGENGVERP